MYNDFKGSKYDGSLKTKDIARLVKKEAMQKYPDLKIKTKSEAYVSINLYIQADQETYRARHIEDIPRDILLNNILRHLNAESYTKEQVEEYLKNHIVKNNKIREIEKDIVSMLESYNYDRSDIMTDYFDKNFCGFVDIELI